MAVEFHQLSSRLANPLRWLNINRLLQPLVMRIPAMASILALLAALPGFLLLIGLPLAAVILLLQLPQGFATATTMMDWALLAISIVILLICGIFSWIILRTPLKPPHGLPLDHTSAPGLLDLIDELENSYGRACVHRVVLRSDFDIQLIRTPRFGLPFWTTNTLAIGLPMLLSLPPSHFKALLARRIGQASGKHNRLTGWFYQLTAIWRTYRDSYARQASPLLKLLGSFFKLYLPVYRKLAFFAMRQDELEADRYALELINDRDLAGVMSQEIITRTFLEQKYWPKIKQLVRRGDPTRYAPYRQMPQVVQKSLTADEARNWLMTAINSPDNLTEIMPPLKSRLENIGQKKTGAPMPLNEVAASAYIVPGALTGVLEKFDQRWLKRQQQASQRS
jgi:hypothetical protein